jgi:GAF domain-containing protein
MGEVRVRYFDALRKAGEAVNSSLKLDEVLQTIVTVTTQAVRVKGCSILLLPDEDSRTLFHAASYGLNKEYLRKGTIEADRSVIVAEALGGKTVVVCDVSEDPRVKYPREAGKEGIAAILFAPLVVRGKVIGVIGIYSDQTGDFTQSSRELLEAIANLSAIAIENARMYESLKEAHQVCLQELWHLQP